MTSESTEMQAFIDFLGKEMDNGGARFIPEQSVKPFRAYQEELARCREAIAPALESSLRGESEPLNMEAIKAQVRRRLEEQGITD